MIEMRHHQLPPVFPGKGMQGVEQDDRIYAAGNSDKNACTAWKQPASVEVLFHALEKFGHATMLICFNTATSGETKLQNILPLSSETLN